MTTLKPTNQDKIGPLQAVAISLVVLVVAGGCLLLSAPESTTLVDGAVDWNAESPLRAVVQLLCLNYQFATINAGEVKVYLLGVGAGLLALALTMAAGSLSPEARAQQAVDSGLQTDGVTPATAWDLVRNRLWHPSPLTAAQLLVCLFLVWSLTSSRWSVSPGLTVGAALLSGIFFLWSFGLAHVLRQRAVFVASSVIIITTGVTAIVAAWYFYGRNPTIRAKFPFGNPNFLATCLVPGMLLSLAMIASTLRRWRSIPKISRIGRLVGCVVVVMLAGQVLMLTESRGPAVGLAVGMLACLFFSLRGWAKMLPVGLAIALVVVGWMFFLTAANEASPTGRSATLRFRAYAWSYAERMFEDRPITGHGLGGFVMKGDSYAVGDVLSDPSVFVARIAHAHNEWLEVLADLGLVGFVLIVGAMFMTLRAGVLSLRTSGPEDRWIMVGLLSAFVSLIVAETFGVGLRVSGVPTLFYTVLGLIWAGARQTSSSFVWQISATTQGRLSVGIVGGTVGLLSLVLMQQDFQAAQRGYKVEQYLDNGQYEEAVELAESSTSQLNPQRALSGLLRVGEAHMLTAQKYQRRALERQIRANQQDVVDRRLLALAAADRQTSEAHCMASSGYLKELVVRSPGFFNHGWVEYRVNLILADLARANGHEDDRNLAIENARKALDREIRRQPFSRVIALAYASLATPKMNFDNVMVRLARPLRFSRITPDYIEVLARLHYEADQVNGQADPFIETGKHCERIVMEPLTDDLTSPDAWAPEMLRLVASWRFMEGDYRKALKYLLSASKAYERLAVKAPMGTASCFDELAECSFLADITTAALAIEYAHKAVAAAPKSRLGRELAGAVKQRLVSYYLAADHEEDARKLLQALASRVVDEQRIRNELGARYRRLCELVLTRPDSAQFRKPATTIGPKLDHWITRSLILNPADFRAHYLACDLALHNGECKTAAIHLRQALVNGLEPATAAAFAQVAIERPDVCDALLKLAGELNVRPNHATQDDATRAKKKPMEHEKNSDLPSVRSGRDID